MSDASKPTAAHRPGHDAPVSSREDDDLERWPIAQGIHRVIAATPKGWSTRIGLYGRWGTGKTSVLNFLEQMETSVNAIVVRFSAWSAVGEGEIVAQFYDELTDELKKKGFGAPFSASAKRWAQRIVAHSKGAGEVAKEGLSEFAPGAGAVASALGGAAGLIGSLLKVTDEDLRKLRQSLGGRRVVVFIDDLDRADPRLIPKTLLALRELLDWPDFAFVLAFDKDVVASALREYSKAFGESAQQFLDKIIDVPFHLPEPRSEHVRRLANRVLEQCADFVPATDRARAAKWFPANPRQAKLIARSLSVLRDAATRHDPDELDWYAMIVQTVLRHCSPGLAEVVERDSIDAGVLGWRSFLDSDAEFLNRDAESEESKKLDMAVESHAPRASTVAEQGWLRDLAREVVRARTLQQKQKIEYEMSLAIREPCLTWKEFRALLSNWSPVARAEVVDHELEAGAKRAASTRKEAARELLEATINHYAGLLHSAAQTPSRTALEKRAAEATHTIGLLNFLWSDSAPPELRELVRIRWAVDMLFDKLSDWVHFTINPSDASLRVQELELMARAARACDDKVGFFMKTKPTSLDRVIATSVHERDAREAWLAQVRGAVLPEVLQTVLNWFDTRDGIAQIVRGDVHDSQAAWLLESPDSPLYRDDASVTTLVAMLDAAAHQSDHAAADVLARNARDYVLMLLGEARGGGSWMGPEQLRGFIAKHPSIVPAAWRAMIAVEYQYRFKDELRSLRKKLLGAGVPETEVPLPTWLAEMPGHGGESQAPSMSAPGEGGGDGAS